MRTDQGMEEEGYELYLIWLCEQLALLASDSGNQERYLRAIGTWDLLDELGLQWDDCYEVLLAQDAFPRGRLTELEEVDAALTAVPSEAWRGRVGLRHHAWESVRGCAAEALPSALELLRKLNPIICIRCPGTLQGERVFTGTKTRSSIPGPQDERPSTND